VRVSGTRGVEAISVEHDGEMVGVDGVSSLALYLNGLGHAGLGSASVITLKPAIRDQFKTGHRDWPKT
jgi:hypothetical protein